MAYPLYIAFVWHMHQPYYKDPVSGQFALPWTRLHATKDYLHMAEVLADFPKVHVTFNYVPCLVEQLEDYVARRTSDAALQVCTKDQLSAEDKQYILGMFFNVHRRNFARYARYQQLLRLRDEARDDGKLLGDQYWLDLIAYFHLCWIDPGYVARDAELSALLAKGQDFTHADIALIAAKSHDIMAAVLPTLRRLQEQGQVEVSTSPYFHPILPLLMDTTSARGANPGLPLPNTVFSHPEDALEQVRRAVRSYHDTFGAAPRGMWPSEGCVSQALAELLAAQTDLRWIASDEAILARSLGAGIERDGYGHVNNPRLLYQPYNLQTKDRHGAKPLAIVFRDHVLSDRIGFVYKHMDSAAAAGDLLGRLREIRHRLGATDRPFLVSIILDGENCWEEYEANGDPFLRSLYGGLAAADDLACVTVSEYLAQFAPRHDIPRLAAGSWINGDMLTWIGEPAQNEAWEFLGRTRQQLSAAAREDSGGDTAGLAQAYRELYIAEGSDWFWWYYTRNDPEHHSMFDLEFRRHLLEVYRILGQPSPGWLQRPITVQRAAARGRAPSGYITPPLTAQPVAGDEWRNAGLWEPDRSSGAMQQVDSLLSCLYYGYNQKNLYLRCETESGASVSFVVIYANSGRGRTNRNTPLLSGQAGAALENGWSLEILLDREKKTVQVRRAEGHEIWQPMTVDVQSAFAEAVTEVGLPLDALGVREGDTIGLVLGLGRNSHIEERHPPASDLRFTLMAP